MISTSSKTFNSPNDRVAAIAYRLWLEEGQPEGRAEAHWFRALELASAEAPVAANDSKPSRKPAAAAAKKSAPRKRS